MQAIGSTGAPVRLKNDWRRSNYIDGSTMAITLLPTEFREFLSLLNANQVDYLLIGGYAVIYYSAPRATGDIDFFVSADHENLVRLSACLMGFGFTVSPQEMFVGTIKTLRIGREPLRIEVLTEISGVEFAEAFTRRREVTIDEIPVNLISEEDLKRNKRASGRLKDLMDLNTLES